MKIERYFGVKTTPAEKTGTKSTEKQARTPEVGENRDTLDIQTKKTSKPELYSMDEVFSSQTSNPNTGDEVKPESEPIPTESGFTTSDLIQGELKGKPDSKKQTQTKPRPLKVHYLSSEEFHNLMGKGRPCVTLIGSNEKSYASFGFGKTSTHNTVQKSPTQKLLQRLQENRHRIYDWTGTEADQIHNGKMELQGHQWLLEGMNKRIQDIVNQLGITEDFTLDWNTQEGSLKVGGIPDEEKRKALEKALVNSPGLAHQLNSFSLKDMMVNDRVDEFVYPAINAYLKNNFSVEIAELTLTSDGKIQSGNTKLDQFLAQSGKGQGQNQYPPLPYRMTTLNNVLPELVKNGPPEQRSHIFQFEWKDGEFQFQNGDVKLGSGQLTEEQRESRDFLLKMQYSGFIELYYLDKKNGAGIFKE